MHRRGGKFENFPDKLMKEIYTPDDLKLCGYPREEFGGAKFLKRAMSKLMRPIYWENEANNILVVNQGKEWGKW
jgi:hypothetical protein